MLCLDLQKPAMLCPKPGSFSWADFFPILHDLWLVKGYPTSNENQIKQILGDMTTEDAWHSVELMDTDDE